MKHRHLTSRKVVLTAAFLALAAGGTAACDASTPDDVDGIVTAPVVEEPVIGEPVAGEPVDEEPVDEEPVAEEPVDETGDDEVFYCADTDGQIVDEEYCDDDPDGNTYLFWHSPSYRSGLPRGSRLDGGEQFASGDSDARDAYRLPTSGRVSNGTIKTNVVGRGSATSGFDSSAGG